MELFNSVSFVAAFLAGIAALFAPCCITVLLPSYLASVFRQKSTVFLMTFVFFLGLLTVFLPIGLSFGVVGQLISAGHDLIFLTGGLFLTSLGLFILLGFHFSLPFGASPNLQKVNPWAVYILGIFSALATTCCAPVLAGVVALSVLPGSIFWAGLYTVAYVLGMALPLFILSVFLDKPSVKERLFLFKKRVGYSLGLKRVELSISEVLSGGVFLLMGLWIIYLTKTGRLATHADYQLTINLYLAQINSAVNRYLGIVPQFFWALIFLIVFLSLVWSAVSRLRKS